VTVEPDCIHARWQTADCTDCVKERTLKVIKKPVVGWKASIRGPMPFYGAGTPPQHSRWRRCRKPAPASSDCPYPLPKAAFAPQRRTTLEDLKPRRLQASRVCTKSRRAAIRQGATTNGSNSRRLARRVSAANQNRRGTAGVAFDCRGLHEHSDRTRARACFCVAPRAPSAQHDRRAGRFRTEPSACR